MFRQRPSSGRGSFLRARGFLGGDLDLRAIPLEGPYDPEAEDGGDSDHSPKEEEVLGDRHPVRSHQRKQGILLYDHGNEQEHQVARQEQPELRRPLPLHVRITESMTIGNLKTVGLVVFLELTTATQVAAFSLAHSHSFCRDIRQANVRCTFK